MFDRIAGSMVDAFVKRAGTGLWLRKAPRPATLAITAICLLAPQSEVREWVLDLPVALPWQMPCAPVVGWRR